MQKIDATLQTFVDDLQHPPSPQAKSLQSHLPLKLKKITELFRKQDENWEFNRGKTFCHLLDKLERKPVVFGGDDTEMNQQNACFSSYFAVAIAVKNLLVPSSHPKAQGLINEIARRVAGLQYRMEVVNGGLGKTEKDEAAEQKLQEFAIAWKKSQPLFADKTLTDKDKRKISEVCAYPKIVSILLADKILRKVFFAWALKDNGGVSQFVEFPSTCARVKAVLIAPRVGRLGENLLRIEKKDIESKPGEPQNSGKQEKVLTLPFYTNAKVVERISILDESKEIEMYGGWRLTIRKIFEVFAKKNDRVGDFEMFESRGIDVWNSHELGRWNVSTKRYDHIDLTVDDWWKAIPVMKEETKQELEARYQVSLAPGQWLVCFKASRATPDLDVDGQHGFREIAIPNEKGTYDLYPFGNFPPIFPDSTLKTALFLANTVRSRIACPDENVFYSHRQMAAYPVPCSEEEGLKMMKAIQLDAQKAKSGDIVFQFAGKNCAYWAGRGTSVLDNGHLIPNLYEMPLAMARPGNPLLKVLFSGIRKAPARMQPHLFRGLDICFGSFRGVTIEVDGKKVRESHMTGECRTKSVMFQPGLLHEQILAGEIPGVVYYGH